MTQPMPGKPAEDAENELDIRGLFRTLWAGKLWIIGMGLAFALIALAYTFFARQEWSATAITDRPTVNMLGGYYSQQQFLRNLDIKADLASVDQPSAMDEAYKEFIMQLASWDTRRDFWLQTDYYKQRQSGNARADAAMLDDLINNIQFMPGDAVRNTNDSVKLIAETAPDANNLLRQYIAFASQRAARHLNDELKGAWAARTVQMKAQVKRQEEELNARHQLPEVASGAPEDNFRNQQDGDAEQEDALHLALHFGVDDKRHHRDERYQHRHQVDFPVLGGRETGGFQLPWQGHKGGHQHDMQAHNAEIELQQFGLRQHFAEAAFYHARFAVQHVAGAIGNDPNG